MFISKAQLEIVQFSSPDETRHALRGIHFTENEAAATDGHRLMVVEHGELPDNINWDAFEAPGGEPTLPATLHVDSIETILKSSKIKKKRDHCPIHDWVWIGQDHARFLDVNLKVVQMPVEWVDGKFPNYKQVTPLLEDRPLHYGFSARYLSDGDYLADEKSKILNIHLSVNTQPALITGENRQGQKGQYVVMPMGVDPVGDYHEKVEKAAGWGMVDAEPFDMRNLVFYKGNAYLKSDLDAFIASKEKESVAA